MIVLFHVLVALFTVIHRIQNAADNTRSDLRQIKSRLTTEFTAWAHPNPLRPGNYQPHHHHTARSRQLRATTAKASYTLAGGGQ